MKRGIRKPYRSKWFARQSLRNKYLLIVLGSLLFLPIVLPAVSVSYIVLENMVNRNQESDLKYGDASQVRTLWYAAAAEMEGKSTLEINHLLQELKAQYPEASMFWVNNEGVTGSELPSQAGIPDQWTPGDAVAFMKKSVNSDPYTVVAFMGKDNASSSFMVLQIPRNLVERPPMIGTPVYIAMIFMVLVLFITISILFFRHIQKRLLHLQTAMVQQDEHGIPKPVEIRRQDEIGALEAAFNGMIEQLSVSRRRQVEEETLRKSLIANLSHDLRTPLTVMSGHLYGLQREDLSGRGRNSLDIVQDKVSGLSELIDNLLTHTLMTSGRYQLAPEPLDVLRLVRESAASWYPIWERERMEIEVLLPEEAWVWNVDKSSFQRILDNLFQNIVRHASQGKYIGLSAQQRAGKSMLVIADRGTGMQSDSEAKGAGIGLAIVNYLIVEMGLGLETDSSNEGTRIYIYELKK
ncbi:histidine kinase dimerization/phospho-acceptor domain-containing protein [Paenibacillus sp. GCM10027629]|uniref:HAMP domain-containing sensor histidine kinase n=1 Tax=Paenibacillus sp. GCM10027629 TaxID=3273414 RepID=UPI003643EB00